MSRCYFHNWKVFETKDRQMLRDEVFRRMDGNSDPLGYTYVQLWPQLQKKICLKCEKIKDEIAPVIREFENEYREELEELKKLNRLLSKNGIAA